MNVDKRNSGFGGLENWKDLKPFKIMNSYHKITFSVVSRPSVSP